MKRPQRVPSVPLHTLRAERPETAAAIEKEALKRGVPVQEFIAELVLCGWEGQQVRSRE